jgi:hypothetical protein
MTWARFDDDFTRHPKIVGLSDRAFRAYVDGICYGSRYGTDGRLPYAHAVTWGMEVRAELVASGLWEEAGRDVRIHDFLIYQRKREDVDRIRESKRIAGRYGAAKRWGMPTDTDTSHKEPNTLVQDKPARAAYSAEFEAFWAAYPVKKGKDGAYRSWKKVRKRGIANDVLIAGARAYAADRNRDPEKTKFAQGWLSDGRWEDDYSVAPVAPALVRTTTDPEWAEKMLGEMPPDG